MQFIFFAADSKILEFIDLIRMDVWIMILNER